MSDALTRAVIALRDGFFEAHTRAHPEDAAFMAAQGHPVIAISAEEPRSWASARAKELLRVSASPCP